MKNAFGRECQSKVPHGLISSAPRPRAASHRAAGTHPRDPGPCRAALHDADPRRPLIEAESETSKDIKEA